MHENNKSLPQAGLELSTGIMPQQIYKKYNYLNTFEIFL